MTSFPSSVDCPANNCTHGDVSLSEWRSEDGDSSPVAAGFCDSCGFASVYCQECGEVTLFIDHEERQCDSCPAVYQQDTDKKGMAVSFRRVS